MKGSKHLTIVIKLGTSSIVHEKTHEPLLSILGLIVETAKRLRSDGHRVVIVSSGAIGVALQMMDLEKRPKHLPAVQALAALGQCRLMSLWDMLFQTARQPVAQILLTRNDIADRTQYLNAQNTMVELLGMGVIPIVNENDTLSVAEIKFGDNDTLSAITAGMVHADYLFLMTDVDCLYTTNPRIDPSAAPIEVVSDISVLVADVSSAGSSLGTGGMSTKITAAKLATAAGVTTIITRSSKPGNVFDIVDYLEALRTSNHNNNTQHDQTATPQTTQTSPPTSSTHLPPLPSPPLHTRFLPAPTRIRDRSFWLLHGLAPHGTIYIDQGAHAALSAKAGLLPVGIVDVEGNFAQQEAVRLVVVKRLDQPRLYSGANTPAPLSRPGSGLWTPPVGGGGGGGVGGVGGVGVVGGAMGSGSPSTPAESRSPNLASYESTLELEHPAPHPLSQSHASTTSIASLNSGVGANDISSQDLLGGAAEAYEKLDPAPREVGRALVNYSALEIARIKGLRSGEIVSVLGYADSEYVALRENVVLLEKMARREKKREERKKEEQEEQEEGERERESVGGHGRKESKGRLGDLASFA